MLFRYCCCWCRLPSNIHFSLKSQKRRAEDGKEEDDDDEDGDDVDVETDSDNNKRSLDCLLNANTGPEHDGLGARCQQKGFVREGGGSGQMVGRWSTAVVSKKQLQNSVKKFQ